MIAGHLAGRTATGQRDVSDRSMQTEGRYRGLQLAYVPNDFQSWDTTLTRSDYAHP
jgi:hypothetical protein